MPCFGGVTPYPKRMGGGRPRAKVILDSLNAGRGTGLDTAAWVSPVYGENVVAARAIAAAWSTNQRLANIWDSRRLTGNAIGRWEKIRAIVPNYGDGDATRRARLVAVEALSGINPTHQTLSTLLSNALGSVFVALEYISATLADIHVPDASYPFGRVSTLTPWASTVAHLLVRVQAPTGITEGAFYEAAGKVFSLLDPVVPAWVTIDWYRPGTVSVALTGGPSAAGFYWDDAHNLDNEIFDDVTDPTRFVLSSYYRTNFTGSPWFAMGSNGSSQESGSLTEATNPPAVGAAVNGFTPADFDGVNDTLASSVAISRFVSNASGSIISLFFADTAFADPGAASFYLEPALFSDSSDGFTALSFSTAGVRFGCYNGAGWNAVATACATGGWHLAQARWNSTTIEVRVDSGAWQTLSRTVTLSTSSVRVGRNYDVGYFDGKILETMTALTRLSDATFDYIKTYINSRYALAL